MPAMTRFLRRTPLWMRLVAVVLTLVAIALAGIGLFSSIALRQYLIGRIDDQLRATSHSIDVRLIPQQPVHGFVPPTNWLITLKDVHGNGTVLPPSLTDKQQPLWPGSISEVTPLVDKPYTVRSVDGHTSWRLLITPLPNGQLLILGQSLTDVDGAVHRLIGIELIVGAMTVIVVTALGAALVRASLRPLVEIETTAAAIAAGDLTRRVPEFEPGEATPRTEVGHLGRALNTMLAHIERAFSARAASEAAARTAASAAQVSETRARRSEERMRQFAADASHELRTPLTTIRGFAELYRQGAARDPEETARLLRRIEDEASRMGLLVEDMLLLARLDQERPLDRLPVDLRVIGTDAVVNARVVAPGREIDLDIATGVGPLIVEGDELRLRQVVTNLMTNALTYTPATAPITLRLAAGRPGYAELAVVDHGPGLSPEQVERVFERFYRGDVARTRRAEGGHSSGTGLGLAIVAALVSAHGGTVDVTGTPGSGATFRVTLPLVPPDTPDVTESTEMESAMMESAP